MDKITYSFTTNKNQQETQNAIKEFAKANNLNITNSLHSIRTSIEKKNVILGSANKSPPLKKMKSKNELIAFNQRNIILPKTLFIPLVRQKGKSLVIFPNCLL